MDSTIKTILIVGLLALTVMSWYNKVSIDDLYWIMDEQHEESISARQEEVQLNKELHRVLVELSNNIKSL